MMQALVPLASLALVAALVLRQQRTEPSSRASTTPPLRMPTTPVTRPPARTPPQAPRALPICFKNEKGERECYARPLELTAELCARLKFVAQNATPDLKKQIAEAMIEDWGDDDCPASVNVTQALKGPVNFGTAGARVAGHLRHRVRVRG